MKRILIENRRQKRKQKLIVTVDKTYRCVGNTPDLYLGNVCLETLPGHWLN
jgi:hypothetical protein